MQETANFIDREYKIGKAGLPGPKSPGSRLLERCSNPSKVVVALQLFKPRCVCYAFMRNAEKTRLVRLFENRNAIFEKML